MTYLHNNERHKNVRHLPSLIILAVDNGLAELAPPTGLER